MHQVALLSEFTDDRAIEIKLGDDTVILVQDGDAVRAFQGNCPHAGAPLAQGAVCRGRIICPWHKAAFSVHDGALLEPPALKGLATYRTEIRDGAVFVDGSKREQAVPVAASDDRHVVILGAGAAGAACASALRDFGFGGAISMVSREPDPPYDRTALSKFVLEGGTAPQDVAPLLPERFFGEHQVEKVTAAITGLDVAARRVELQDGRTLAFTHAVIATGGKPRTSDIPGADLDGVFTLRSKADAAEIVDRATEGGRAVILGSSFIGLEAASALRKRGLEVAVIAPDAIPFVRLFGERIGSMFRRLHEDNGVVFHAETKAARITGAGKVAGIVLESGAKLPADLVLVGIGVDPATTFIEGLDLAQDGGIDVDATMQAAAGIYAAGDVARFPLNGGAARIEHWRVAQQQARIAARNIVGQPARYEGVPFFWTYHFGKRFEYLGHATHWDEVVVEGSLDDQNFVALLGDKGLVVGVLACERERATCLLLDRLRDGIGVEAALALIRAE